ncbi:cyclic nucleotide-binding domain-containing protein [bacterium]|nr:cyclic nucleotide-binding domain-containing protein [bacterium]
MSNENPVFHILEKVPLFKDLNEDSANLIANKITLQYYPANKLIFSQGENGDAMYIIKKGEVRIFQGPKDDPDEQLPIATLQDNSFFGEMALVSENSRNASAITLEESEIFILKKEDFYSLINNNPSLAEQISSEFIHRIRENMRNKSFSQNN